MLLTGIFIILIGCISFTNQKTYQIQKDITFKKIDGIDLKGDLYLPLKSGLKPAVIVVHGGGWDHRSGDMESICKKLASEGIAAFNITYRLAPEHLYPKAVTDVKDAITWLSRNSSQYEIDPQKIAGWGYSAGANLILLAGLEIPQSLKVIVGGGSPTDLTAWPKSPLVRQWLGAERDQNLSLWKEASPVTHVTGASPPIFLYHGEWDNIVEIQQMEKLKAVMETNNRSIETFEIPLLGHFGVYFLSNEAVERGIQFLHKKL